jgi:pimeloyl-ACP methyl ester carboxylesterase
LVYIPDNTLSSAIWFTLHLVTSSIQAPHKITQPLIFLPGTLCDERIFMPCWQHLDAPYQAYVPLQWAENMAQMKALAHDRLAYFDEPVHLVGFSMGGYIAALIAIEAAPQKIASLTLIGNTCQALPDVELKQRASLLLALEQTKFKGMSEKQIAVMLHQANSENSAVIKIIRDMEQDLGMATLASQLRATSERNNLLRELAKCHFKTHFIAGEQDHLVTEIQLKFAQQQIKGSTLSLVAGAGHMLPLEQPRLLADVIAGAKQ